ncbi:MAG: prepilin-type N-terminal cleavage/methylation domain-containing protein [Halarcobacter sp.]
MKKSFTLMEVIIAVVLLSTVMVSMFQIKSNNIFILGKADENRKNRDYLLFAINTDEASKRNKNVYLDRLYNIKDDDLRRELKQVKVNVKDDILDTEDLKYDNFTLKISEFKTTYSFDKTKKDIYRFKLSL